MPSKADTDLLVIGGGINGAGIARDAAGRGLRVTLVDKGDLGGATSSASTKLIHGGLRYLEHYEFRLVRESLLERELLLRAAPHIIWPLRFILPHARGMRPSWMIRAGLFLYDNLGTRAILPGSKRIRLRQDPAGAPLNGDFRIAFSYADCWVQDNRMVILNAQDAAARGAEIRPHTECVAAERRDGLWQATLKAGNHEWAVTARALINAAGPWVDQVTRNSLRRNDGGRIRLVRGSHIVTRRLFDHDGAYLFQNSDGRVIFAIPYERDFTLIGTTDVDHDDLSTPPRASPQEQDYLCRAVSTYLAQPVTTDQIVWSYAGVRPLHGDEDDQAQKVSRDYELVLEADPGAAPLLTVYGGKLTTFRVLAEQATDKTCTALDHRSAAWTGQGAVLPGGDIGTDFDAALKAFCDRHPWLPTAMAWRLLRNYGSAAETIIGQARTLDDLGTPFGADLYEAELRYTIDHEWVTSGADYLWRRSKMGLRLDEAERRRVETWIAAAAAAPAA